MAIGSLVAVPDLQAEGPARLEGQRPGFIQIRFLASGAEMTAEARQVVRYVLLPGTRVMLADADDDDQREAEIGTQAPRNDERGLLVYGLADGAEIAEDRIALVATPRDPGERLRTAAFHELRPRFERAGTPREPEPWGPMTLCAREQLMAWRDRAWEDTGGVVALAGARIEPLPHQLLTARRVLADRQVRFLLADEVGLGKTIEAGLVMQSLFALRPQLRVLVIAPGALISQWFVELYLRFGGRRFLMLDAERLADHRGNPWDEPCVIASSRALEGLEGAAALRFATSSWDLVIVDECHRMEPDGLLYRRIAQLSRKVPHLLLLSATPERQHPAAYLALLHLLQPEAYPLDEPEAFERKLDLADRVGRCIAAAAAADSPAAVASACDAWGTIAADDETLATLLATWRDADAARRNAARDAVLAHAREHYVLDHRVIRHRRAVLARLAETTGVGHLHLASRSREWVDYRPDAPERAVRTALAAYRDTLVDHYHGEDGAIPPRLAHWLLQLELACQAHPRLLDRLLAMRAAVREDPADFAEYRERAPAGEDLAQVLRGDLSDAERTAQIAISAASCADADIEDAPLAALREAAASWAKRAATARTKALIGQLEAFWDEHPQEKVLVFTAHPLAVESIAEAIAAAIEGSVLTFGAHQEAAEREEAARRFAADDRAWVMVCDPLGGEGRNFQFVSVVAHHDLPWSLAAVEQRIGRVDRIGRDGDVPSWVLRPSDPAAVDRAWGAVLDDAVAAFTSSTSGLEFVAREIEQRALDAALRGGGEALADLLDELRARIEREREGIDHALDECYAEGEAAYRDACSAVETIAAAQPPVGALVRWLRSMGGGASRDDDPWVHWRLRPRSREERTEGTFDRELALRQGQLAFFALGHELVDEVVDDAAGADWCTANAWRRSAKRAQRWDGLRVVFELAHDLGALVAAGLPLESLRRVLTVAPPLRALRCFRLDGEEEQDEDLRKLLAPGFDSRRGDRALSPRTSRETWMRPWLGGKAEQVHSWQDGIARAWSAAEARRQALADELRAQARSALQPALEAPVRAATARAELAARELGAEHPDVERLRSEAEAEAAEAEALLATVTGAELRIASVAYVVVGS